MKNRIIAAIGLLIAFFMPWFKIMGILRMTGYEISKMQLQPGMLNIEARYYSFLLFLIPLFCVIIVVVELSGRTTRPFAGLVGLYSFMIILSLVDWNMETLRETMAFLDFGYFLALVAAVCLVITARSDEMGGRTRPRGLTETQKAFRDQMK